MKVTFLLPCHTWKPVGGFRVAFQYANQLAGRGYEVTIVLPRAPAGARSHALTGALRYGVIRLVGRRTGRWLFADPRIRIVSVSDLKPANIPNGDFIFATAWETAEAMALCAESQGRKMYLVYDLEVWMTASQAIRRRMLATYQADFSIIATSGAVSCLLQENGASIAALVRAGIDFSNFRIRVPMNERQWGSIGFPVRKASFKGTADAVAALEIVRERFGESIKVTAFGPEPFMRLPRWISYLKLPSDDDLAAFYNALSIFVLPSHYEGWGLPGVEALACGAALVTTDSGGVRDYASDSATALVVPRQRPDLIANAVAELLVDDNRRRQLAHAGWTFVQQYTWEAAADSLERVMRGALLHDQGAIRELRSRHRYGQGGTE